ncbi:uncharacterized protein LOC119911968 [Micropterus salmoides]|uniref:uncharacterized protein LOC119911968 n=1 Tax=Micropterus salmoides TaxID=27706 RepID=UPI0018EB4B50|nr:uncharacterized protein LOC119911968 [Micropterus salmoides]
MQCHGTRHADDITTTPTAVTQNVFSVFTGPAAGQGGPCIINTRICHSHDPTQHDEPVCEEEEAGGRGLPEEEEQQSHVEDSWSCDVLGHTEEEAGEDGGQESAEEPVQSTSLDEEDLGDPDHQITNTRGQCVKRKRSHLNLRVCLLEDSQTTVLTKGVLKHLVQDLRCDRGLQENDFLDLLRSTFPQLTGHFDVFTTDTTRTLTPLKLNTLTPEEIQRSIQSIGKGRSALYIRAKRKDEAVNDTSNDKNRPHASSHNNPQEKVEVNKADRVFNSRWQQVEAEKNKEYGISDDFSALSSARSAAERDDEDEVEEDDGDEEWKPDKKDEELRESDTEQNSSKTMTKPREVEHSGVITKKRKQVQSSLKASTDKSDTPLSCKVCQALRRSMNMLIKHAWSHLDDPEALWSVWRTSRVCRGAEESPSKSPENTPLRRLWKVFSHCCWSE